MELREFVKESLTEILGGIADAQAALPQDGKGGAINPAWNGVEDMPDHVQTVKFDVAVTASDQNTKGGKGGIKVLSVEIGGKLESQEQNRTVSRVSFSVPIVPPMTVVQGVRQPERRARKGRAA